MALSITANQFLQSYPGPFEIRQKSPNRRKSDIVGFEILCTNTNTPIAFTDASMFLDAEGAKQTATLFVKNLNLIRSIYD